ncbi:hypothetical protein B7Y94_00150 [Candidatus Saccharibacteria bacterium 32-49-12]|nr:MAG: hypothetical protein B7Y94_00150 [Candidatus Saccharibacteria bacterium 32-49-12]
MANRRKNISIVVVGLLVLVWLIVGAGFLGAWLSSKDDGGTGPVDPGFDGNTVVTDEEADLASLVKKVSPSVVSIMTTQTAGQGYSQQELEGAGTGIIISSDGYVLTNKHVVSSAQSVQVVASNGTRYENVKLVGSDPLNDIAFLKIQGVSDLPAATLGDSGTVRVGQGVITIGNSLGQYQNTVTSGIISGLGRPVTAASDKLGSQVESLTDLLQTDAAINPGNSGGPLINMAGQVIGINTAIVSDAQSIGFAIPINAAKGLIRGVLKDGTIQKAYLGVQYVAITPDVRVGLELDQQQGALVQSGRSGSAVVSGGPADKAGVKDGDIITKVNGKVVGEQGGLGSLVAEFLPGEEIELTLVRDGRSQTVKLTLGAYPTSQ